MRVIGTAGHVDHGKSTLVEALTGVHPDRLKEEREREMTIDLGFAWLTLADGEEVGIVDVPGHRDFIENMLAGVGGIDAALFVVAADEGVMPQTREHLAILDLLEIGGGVVALTKIDMVEEEWVELVAEDVRAALAGTVLADAPIIPVSGRARFGLDELRAALAACLADRPPRPDYGRPRLPIDRIFTIPGFGTVVTGTLSDGALRVGDEVAVEPLGLRSRVRGLQTHKRKEEVAPPGGRTAVNLTGLTVEQLQRGAVVAHPGDYRPTRRLDVRFRLLPDVSQPMEHNTEVKLYLGASETVARLRLWGREALLPGETGWLQLELEAPVVALRGDHYILRRPSPGETLGGGRVVDPFPKGRHKRFAEATLASLAALAQGTPAEILEQTLLAVGAAPLKEVYARSNLDLAAAQAAAAELAASGALVVLEERPDLTGDALVSAGGPWQDLRARALAETAAYHRSFPLRAGLPKEELKSRLKAALKGSPRLFPALLRRLVSAAALVEAGPLVRLPEHTIRFTPEQQRRLDGVLARFAAAPYAPPSVKEVQTELGDDLYAAVLEGGRLTAVAPDVVFRTADLAAMTAAVRVAIQAHGPITAAQVRDQFNTSRRYALALLEYLDATGVTVREGDARRLRR
jgi:selenocysteine-specific elongation factor